MSQNHQGLLWKGTLMGPTAASAGPKTSEKDNPAGPGFSPFSLPPNQPQAVPQGQATVSEWTPVHVPPSRETQVKVRFHWEGGHSPSLSDINH